MLVYTKSFRLKQRCTIICFLYFKKRNIYAQLVEFFDLDDSRKLMVV